MQVFVTFCGLGIHNVMTYEKIQKASAMQAVALEVRMIAGQLEWPGSNLRVHVHVYSHAFDSCLAWEL